MGIQDCMQSRQDYILALKKKKKKRSSKRYSPGIAEVCRVSWSFDERHFELATC